MSEGNVDAPQGGHDVDHAKDGLHFSHSTFSITSSGGVL